MAETIGAALLTLAETVPVGMAVVDASLFLIENALLINTVGALAISSAQASAQRRKAREFMGASAQDRHITLRSATAPRREVLGRAITGGDLLWAASTGTDKTKLVMIIALSAREIDGVETVFYEGDELTLDAQGYATSGPFGDASRGVTSAQQQTTIAGVGSTIVLDHPPLAGSIDLRSLSAFDPGTGYATAMAPLSFSLSGSTLTVASAYSGGVVVSYQHASSDRTLRVLFHTGAAGQVVDPEVTALFPAEWDSSHRLDGVAYAAVFAEYNTSAFPGGLKGLSFLVRGSKVLDPRTGTTAWTDNPPLLMRHVCTQPLDPATRPTPVDDAWCIAAANVCDGNVSYTIGGTPATRKRFVAGTVYSEAEAPKKCLDDLAQAMAGGWVFTEGALRMRAGAYATPVMTLTEVDFAGGEVDVTPRTPREQLINVANGRAFDPANRWQFVDVPEVRSSAYITEDGGALPPLQVDLSAVYDMAQAQQVLAIMMREARAGRTLKATFRMRAYPVQVFDVINLRCAKYFGATAIPMLVLARRWALPTPGDTAFGIELTMRATGAAVYADDTAFDQPLVPPANLLPLPWQVRPPGALTISSNPALAALGDGTQTSRMLVSWPAITDAAVLSTGTVEIQYWPVDQALPAGDWMSVQVPGRATQATVAGVQQRRQYLVRARCWSGMVASGWGVHVVHEVLAAPLLGAASLAPGAATTVLSPVSSSSVTVSNALHSPDNLSWRTVIGSKTFTPDVDCTIEVSCIGTLDYTTSSSGGYIGSLNHGIYTGSGSGTLEVNAEWYMPPTVSPVSYKLPISVRKAISLTAGTTYTFSWAAAKWSGADAANVVAPLMEFVVIKR